MRLVIASDTHGLHDAVTVPDGDVFIHAGDLTSVGDLDEISNVVKWIRGLPHRHRVVIAGNHDRGFEEQPADALRLLGVEDGITYLQDSGVVIDGIKFWGSPWQPEFLSWAFNLPRGAELACKWNLVPRGTDVFDHARPPYDDSRRSAWATFGLRRPMEAPNRHHSEGSCVRSHPRSFRR